MDAQGSENVRNHWQHVHDASQQPFDFSFFDRDRFVYDTEPACRAVVVMRRHGMELGLAALRRIHEAFYAENRDVTDIATLATIVTELGLDEDAFRGEFAAEAAKRETLSDFATAQNAGVRGFPTVIAGAGKDNGYALVTNGFQSAANILPALKRWIGECKAT